MIAYGITGSSMVTGYQVLKLRFTYFILCVSLLSAHRHVALSVLVLMVVRRRHWIPWVLSYR